MLRPKLSECGLCTTTESGYDNGFEDFRQNNGVTELASYKYVPRQFMDFYQRGRPTFFLHELADDILDPTGPTGHGFREFHWGLVRHDLSYKPSAYAVKNLIAQLSDVGDEFTPGGLDYSIRGGDSNTRQVLLQKRDGSFVLALWQDTQVYDNENRVDLSNAPRAVTLNVNIPIVSGERYLRDTSLVVRGGEIGRFENGAYNGIQGRITAGRGDGTWNGAGGIVTSMSDSTTSVLTTLAVAKAGGTQYAGGTFGGVSVDADDVLVMYTWGGDADLNGRLDADDYFFIDSKVLLSGVVFGFQNGDFNYDGSIDGDDYFVMDSNFLLAQMRTPFEPSSGARAATAPEPSGMVMLAAGIAAVRRRRRMRYTDADGVTAA